MEQSAKCRQNMLDCQIRPMGVTDPHILEAFKKSPRELFVPSEKQGVAYGDEDLALGSGRYLMEPAIQARLIAAAAPESDEIVLDIATATGYSAAILSCLAGTVVALECEAALLEQAEKNWAALGLCNIAGVQGALEEGSEKHGPYDVIFVNGAIGHIQQSWLDQLAPGGRLVAMIAAGNRRCGEAVLVERCSKGGFSERPLFEGATPCLPGFGPREDFTL